MIEDYVYVFQTFRFKIYVHAINLNSMYIFKKLKYVLSDIVSFFSCGLRISLHTCFYKKPVYKKPVLIFFEIKKPRTQIVSA